MSSTSARPAALHLAVYSDHAAAQRDRDGLAELVEQNAIEADGVVLVTRSADGKIEQALPPGKSGIVALLPEHHEEDAAIAFPHADFVVSHAVDGESAARVRATALGEVESPEGAPRRPHLG